jgi:MATE family multidrug resistance protein
MGKPPHDGDAGALCRIALPLACAYVAETIMSVGNLMIVGRLGAGPLAGVGLASNLLLYLLVVGMDVVGIVSVLLAEAHGRGDREDLSNTLGQGLWLATLVSMPGMVLCWILPQILRLSGEAREVVQQTVLYLHPAVWCVLPTLWTAVLRSFLAVVGRTRPIMLISVVSVGIDLLICYLLVLGRLDRLGIGVAGAGYARSIASTLALIALVAYVSRCTEIRQFRPFRGLTRIHPKRWLEILKLGLPAAGFTLAENGLFSAVGVLMGLVGTSALAASQIGLSAIEPGVMMAFAMGDAATVRIGLWAGRGDIRGVKKAAHSAFILGTVLMCAVGVILWTNARKITSLFIDAGDPANHEVVRLTLVFLSIAAVFQVLDGLQIIATRALWGIKDTVTPVWVAILCFWFVGVGGGCILTFSLKRGSSGLWWGLATGLATAALLLVWRFEASVDRMNAGGGRR